MADRVQIEEATPPDLQLPGEVRADVVVFPREMRGDVGVYDDSVVHIVKEFRFEGVQATYQQEQAARTWAGTRGVSALALELIIGIASNGGWAALSSILRRQHGSDRVSIQAGRMRKVGSEISYEWFKVEGPGDQVADALGSLMEQTAEQESVGKEANEDKPATA